MPYAGNSRQSTKIPLRAVHFALEMLRFVREKQSTMTVSCQDSSTSSQRLSDASQGNPLRARGSQMPLRATHFEPEALRCPTQEIVVNRLFPVEGHPNPSH